MEALGQVADTAGLYEFSRINSNFHKKIIEALYKIKPPFNVNRPALAAGAQAIQDNEWTKKAIEHNTLWSKKIFSVLKENNIKTCLLYTSDAADE